MTGPLDGTLVVALEQAVAGPLCTRHLADLGAEVIKVERPNVGDFARRYEQSLHGTSAHFAWLNWGKQSIAVNLKTVDGIAILHELVAHADVLVSNLGPGVLDRLIPPGERRHDRLVECEISAFGPSGPNRLRKGYDLLIQAEAGVIKATGTVEQPARPGVSIADLWAAGLYATTHVLGQLLARATTGSGSARAVSMFDAVAEWMSPLLVEALATGRAPTPSGVGHASITPYGPFPTNDGFVVLAVQNEGQWTRLCQQVLNRPDLGRDQRFDTNERRCAHRQIVEEAVADGIACLSTAEAVARLEAGDIPWGILNNPTDVVAHSDLVARSCWQQVRLSNGNVGAVLRSALDDDGQSTSTPRVPALGEDTTRGSIASATPKRRLIASTERARSRPTSPATAPA